MHHVYYCGNIFSSYINLLKRVTLYMGIYRKSVLRYICYNNFHFTPDRFIEVLPNSNNVPLMYYLGHLNDNNILYRLLPFHVIQLLYTNQSKFETVSFDKSKLCIDNLINAWYTLLLFSQIAT